MQRPHLSVRPLCMGRGPEILHHRTPPSSNRVRLATLPYLSRLTPRTLGRKGRWLSRSDTCEPAVSNRELYSGMIRLYLLHHAAREPIFGLGSIAEDSRWGTNGHERARRAGAR